MPRGPAEAVVAVAAASSPAQRLQRLLQPTDQVPFPGRQRSPQRGGRRRG